MSRTAVLVAACAVMALVGLAHAKKDKKPNFLLFHPDDLPWLPQWPEGPATLGDKVNSVMPRYVPTPNIDRIRREGAVFENAHVASPICSSARLTTMTSRYNSRAINVRNKVWTGMVGTVEGSPRVRASVLTSLLREEDLSEHVFIRDLKAAGYLTCMAGKWHLGDSQSGWNSYTGAEQDVLNAGYDMVLGLYQHNVVHMFAGHVKDDVDFSHNMEWVTAEALKCIDEAKRLDKPFFMYFNPTPANQPDTYTAFFKYSMLYTPAGHLTEYPESMMPSREEMWDAVKQVLSYEEIEHTEAGLTEQIETCGFEEPGCFIPGFDGTMNSSGMQYPASTALGTYYADASAGALIRKLEEMDMFDDTLFQVMMDHGTDAKNQVFNGGSQILYALRYPKLFKAGTVIPALVSNVDIGPTYIELAGGTPSYLMDGKSWAPKKLGDMPTGSFVVYSEIDYERAVITPKYKLISRGDLSEKSQHIYLSGTRYPDSTDPVQLYDMVQDPYEQKSLAGKNKYADVVEELLEKLECFDELLGVAASEKSWSSKSANKCRTKCKACMVKEPKKPMVMGCTDELVHWDASMPGEPLRQPPEGGFRYKDAGDGMVDVEATVCLNVIHFLGPSFDAYFRVFNHQLVGPTISVKPGDRVKLTYMNMLGPQPEAPEETENYPRNPNSTNMHIHGIHASGELPGDSVYVDIEPGSQFTYDYRVDANHMAGTAWYHPHFHGASALQVLQGSYGAFIIEDPKDSVPKMIQKMDSIIMGFTHLDLIMMPRLEMTAGSTLNTYPLTLHNKSIDTSDVVLINGQFQPEVAMETGKWYRWRMIGGSSTRTIVIGIEADSDCEWQLLAKDGMYLYDAPRVVSKVVLTSGNRADMAVRCNSAGTFQLLTQSTTDEFNFERPTNGLPGDTWGDWPAVTNEPGALSQLVLATLEVSDSGDEPDNDLKPFTYEPWPCYMVDLQETEVAGTNIIAYVANFENFHGEVNNGVITTVFDITTPTATFNVGTVQQTHLNASGVHPHHQHVNPFQIYSWEGVEASTDPSAGNWFKIGDWHDTIMMQVADAAVDIRWQVDQFVGTMIFHCHLLLHEDSGMMGWYHITGGKERTIWWGAKDVDPECMLPHNPRPPPAGK